MVEEEKNEGELLIPSERRSYPRVAIKVKVKYRVLDGDEEDIALTKNFDPDKILKESQDTESINISASGLLMYSDTEIPIKSFLAVNMYLPLPGLSCSCKALGEVVRCEKEGEKYKVGIKFLKILHHNLNKYKFLTLTELLNIKGEEIKLD